LSFCYEMPPESLEGFGFGSICCALGKRTNGVRKFGRVRRWAGTCGMGCMGNISENGDLRCGILAGLFKSGGERVWLLEI
jgi:hypothetical protein